MFRRKYEPKRAAKLLHVDFDDKIGGGAFGVVYGGYVEKYEGKNHKWPGTEVAVKFQMDSEGQGVFMDELSALSELPHHPALIDVVCCPRIQNKDKKLCHCIVTERYKCSLEKVIGDCHSGVPFQFEKTDGTTVEWSDAKRIIIAYGLACGIQCLHSKRMMHLDLKPANIFIDEDIYPKIGDFGLATRLWRREDVGTPLYKAPEVAEMKPCLKSDVWSYGLILYQIIEDTSYDSLKRQVDRLRSGKPITHQKSTLMFWKRLIDRCCTVDPEERIDISSVVREIKENIESIIDGMNGDDQNELVSYVQDLEPYVKEFSGSE